jgi:hypothetical protein
MLETQPKVMTGRFVAEIDPMALLLPEHLYLIWLEIHHPNGTVAASLEEAFERATPHDRATAAHRAETLAAAADAVIKAARIRG